MERLKLLDALGFVWNAPRGAKRKRHVIMSENQCAMVESEVSDSIEANHQIVSGLNERPWGEMKSNGNVVGSLHTHDSRQSKLSPDSNNVNQGMYR
jgi:hypothetical protein